MIKALIFDLDNTLIDRQRAFREMLHREFYKITDDSISIISCYYVLRNDSGYCVT